MHFVGRIRFYVTSPELFGCDSMMYLFGVVNHLHPHQHFHHQIVAVYREIRS